MKPTKTDEIMTEYFEAEIDRMILNCIESSDYKQEFVRKMKGRMNDLIEIFNYYEENLDSSKCCGNCNNVDENEYCEKIKKNVKCNEVCEKWRFSDKLKKS